MISVPTKRRDLIGGVTRPLEARINITVGYDAYIWTATAKYLMVVDIRLGKVDPETKRINTIYLTKRYRAFVHVHGFLLTLVV